MLFSNLQTLEKNIADQWQKNNHSIESFPEICQEFLAEFSTPWTWQQFLGLLIDKKGYPKQWYTDEEFGNPGVTLLRNDKFHIDAYVWTDVDTNIHSHHFAGAFRPIYGISRQLNFKFTPQKVWDPYITDGTLILTENRLLQNHEAVAIIFMDPFIHMTVHIEKPTITLCVRTDDIPGHQNSSYFFPGIKLETTDIREEMRKKIRLLNALVVMGQEDISSLLATLIAEMQPYEIFCLFNKSNIHSLHYHTLCKDFQKQLQKALIKSMQRDFPEWLFMPLRNEMELKKWLGND